jgi:hypothetical protein
LQIDVGFPRVNPIYGDGRSHLMHMIRNAIAHGIKTPNLTVPFQFAEVVASAMQKTNLKEFYGAAYRSTSVE